MLLYLNNAIIEEHTVLSFQMCTVIYLYSLSNLDNVMFHTVMQLILVEHSTIGVTTKNTLLLFMMLLSLCKLIYPGLVIIQSIAQYQSGQLIRRLESHQRQPS